MHNRKLDLLKKAYTQKQKFQKGVFTSMPLKNHSDFPQEPYSEFLKESFFLV